MTSDIWRHSQVAGDKCIADGEVTKTTRKIENTEDCEDVCSTRLEEFCGCVCDNNNTK